jgi:transcription initiation factor IIE alpha subunit
MSMNVKLYRCECGKSKMMVSTRFLNRNFKCIECDTIVDISISDEEKDKYLNDNGIAGVFIWDNSGGK